MSRRTRAPRSLRLRLFLWATLWIAAALVVVGLLLTGLFRDTVERNLEQRLSSVVLTLLSDARVGAVTGAVSVEREPSDPLYQQPFSGWYWQITDEDGEGPAARSLWNARLAAGTPGESASGLIRQTLMGPEGGAIFALSRDVTLPGGTGVYRVTAGAPQQGIDAEVAGFARTLAVSLLILGAGLALAVVLQLHLGLQPLARLRADLAAVREGRRARLSTPGPVAELDPLLHELNGLLDHNAEVVERARRNAGDLAHALKTPLAILRIEVDRAGRDPDGVLDRQMQTIDKLLQHQLRRARAAAARDVPGLRTPLRPLAGQILDALDRVYAERGLTLELDLPDEELAFAGEQQDLQEMLGNLVDNACKWARGRVLVSARRESGELVLQVADDGPGLTEEAFERAVQRGQRLDESVPGSGLGLSIVADLAGFYDGLLNLAPAEDRDRELPGAQLSLRLPAAVG